MSKEIIGTEPYRAAEYLTIGDFLANFGITDVTTVDSAIVAKYQGYVDSGNRTVEAALKKHADKLPLRSNSDTFAFARDMAFYWAKYEKQSDEGSKTTKDSKDQWEIAKQHMVETLQSTPAKTTTRTLTSSGFEDDVTPLFSQTYGLEDFL